MTMFKWSIINIILLVLLSISSYSQWNRSDGPGGGKINALVANGEIIFAGTQWRGIYRSMNGGILWEESNNGLPEFVTVQCFAVQGDTVYAGTYGEGVYRSVDGGSEWIAVSTNLTPLAKEVNVLLVVGRSIFMGASSGAGIWVSSDGGDSWTKKTSGMSDIVYVYSLAYKDGRLFAATAPQGLFKSDDMGENWEPIYVPFGVSELYTSEDYIIAGGRGEGIKRSGDNGETWVDISSGLPQAGLIINTIMSHRNTLFISTPAGVYKSPDWGNTWMFANDGLPHAIYPNQVSSFAQTENELFAAAGGSGVYKKVDGRWIEHNRGLIFTNVSALQYQNGFLYAATRNSGIFRLNVEDGEWHTLDTNRAFIYFDGIAVDNDRIFASANGYGVYKSLNGGRTWSMSYLPIQTQPYVRAISIVANTIIVGLIDAPGIVISFNNGSTWNIRNNGLVGNALSVYDVVHHNGILFAGTSGGVYTSTDWGQNWQLRIDVHLAWSLHIDDGTLFVGCFGGGIIRSDDYGETWSWVNQGVTDGYITSITSVRGVLFASTLIYGHLYVSKNKGEIWQNINEGLPNGVGIRTIASDGRNLYAGLEWFGVWYLPLDDIVPIDEDPKEFRLFQNFPNPFNSLTTIRFSISRTEHVTLKVYGVLGKEITTLVNQYLHPGEYNVQFDPTGYSSGVYYYRMSAGNYAETKKLLIIK